MCICAPRPPPQEWNVSVAVISTQSAAVIGPRQPKQLQRQAPRRSGMRPTGFTSSPLMRLSRTQESTGMVVAARLLGGASWQLRSGLVRSRNV